MICNLFILMLFVYLRMMGWISGWWIGKYVAVSRHYLALSYILLLHFAIQNCLNTQHYKRRHRLRKKECVNTVSLVMFTWSLKDCTLWDAGHMELHAASHRFPQLGGINTPVILSPFELRHLLFVFIAPLVLTLFSLNQLRSVTRSRCFFVRSSASVSDVLCNETKNDYCLRLIIFLLTFHFNYAQIS